MIKQPYLTADMPGIGGRIKEHLSDFQVEEIPLYLPCGKGTHVYFRIQKAGVPTHVAIDRIAKYMGQRSMNVGLAGMKDSQAVTTQMLSLEYADPAKLSRYHDANIKVLDVSFHTNKLRIGHLAGNKFSIKIRGVGATQLAAAKKILDVLAARGVPNYFGQQRFGSRGDTGALGAALTRGDLREFAALFLGRSSPADPPDCRAARDAFDAGYLDRALQRWPRHYVDQRRALIAYKRRKSPVAVVAAVDKRLKRLFVSAFQSEIFNDVLSRRIQTFDRLMVGDLAEKIDSGGVFMVENLPFEQPRAERFEISPTGPIVGTRINFAGGEPGKIELDVLEQYNVSPADFAHIGSLHSKGTRRSLRFKLLEPQILAHQDQFGQYLQISFTASSGCYATVALREIMKDDNLQDQPPDLSEEEVD
ncbi:MAG: tRNA pseudouridine(13) synthase TruD [Planctomycetaceae bacterium]|nr:MAG: tRNA pseudouridine(13) synthase TruD [Planctomycetaceae bacterium]